ncbi:MAG: LCP family protein [Candidatus Magasanikbacteria bacterium]|jgi:polyisoprenyl-teichoic acid--peptidoglycan teichoic acid transferase|nr:LCP family protein [Candidatus Magasanikbacteria bacterium]MBT4071234.1 LCP family protein [Candidatus Magasanikbacteria bacterium]
MRPRPVNFLQRETEQIKSRSQWVVFFVIFTVLAFAITGCVSRLFFSTPFPDDPSAYDPITLEPKKPEGFLERMKQLVFSKDIILEGEKRDRINILVLGQGGIGHDGPYLTDTILLTSIKPSTDEVSMVSIPRDLNVYIPDYGKRKINHANAFGESKKQAGGPILASHVIEETFDQDIDYYIRVDFKAFKELIDDVGGITVNVERSFIDYEYPAPNEEYQTVSFTKGIQTMDGDTALIFARSRHGNNGEGSDYARSKRQQKMILALKEKLLSFETLTNPIKIHKILDSLQSHIVTNMEFSDIMMFLRMAKDLKTSEMITLTLDDSPNGFLSQGFNDYGEWVLEPNSDSFDDINTQIAYIFDEPPNIERHNTPTQETNNPIIVYDGVSIEVQNGTWRAGLAARMKKQLEEKGFYISSLGNTNTRPQLTSSMILLNSQVDKTIIETMQTELQMPLIEVLPEGEKAEQDTDILIILGENFTD